MNNRQTIIATISRTNSETLDEIAELTPAFTRKKVIDTIKDLVKAGMLTRHRDDVTGQPAYRLTESGKAIAKSLAGSGTNNPGSLAPVPTSGESLLAGGQAVIEAETQDKAPADPASDEKADLAKDNDFLRDRLKAKDDELFKQAQVVINLRRELQAANGALEAAKRMQAVGANKYMVLCHDETLFDTPEAAAARALDYTTESDLEDAQIIAVNPVGRIEIKSVFVPHENAVKEAA